MDATLCIGHAALEIILVLMGMELTPSVDASEAALLAITSGEMDRQCSMQ